MLVALLLAVGIGAALQFRFLFSQSQQLASDERAVLTAVDRIDAMAGELGGMVAVSTLLDDPRWASRVTAFTTQIPAVVAEMRPKARSVEAAARLQAIAAAASQLTGSSAHDDILAIRTAATELREAEAAAFDAERTAANQQVMLVPGIAALVWVVGILLLVRIPKPANALELPPMAATATSPVETAPPAQPTVDLAAAADLCTAISRVVSSNALPDMLARASALVDAQGVIVWMGAGEELFAATSHGYDPKVISRLGAIPRTADNATAAAWREGELHTVAGDMMSNGAIVAPMFGPESCIGVLAAEVRHGREEDASTRAVTQMIAAQLATVLSAWPAASAPKAAQA